MMLIWKGIEEFVKIVEKGSFSAAALAMGLSKSHISKHVKKLENRLGVSRRNLEYAFRSQFDKSPAEYIRTVQLNEIRSALLSQKNTDRSIGDIAAELNIWHLSRLAQNYQKLFGELPSKTRDFAKLS